MKPAAILFFAGATFAHDLQVTSKRSGDAIIVECRYAGTDPASYAAVEIFSPADPKQDFQNGRTDTLGRFSFVPDQPGAWKFIVDDELGHRVEHAIAVSDASYVSENTPSSLQKGIVGVSVILGLTGVLYGWKARRAV